MSRRGIVLVLLAVAGVYVLFTGALFWLGTTSYLDIYLTDDQPVVLYAMGYPAAVRETTEDSWVRTQPVSIASANTTSATAMRGGKTVYGYAHWAYTLPEGGQAQFDFEADGKIRRISCLHPEAIPGACPGILGVKLGDDEFRPLWKLGSPTRSQISGLTRTFHYDDVGVEYGLERRRVYRVALTRSNGGGFAHILRYLRSRVP